MIKDENTEKEITLKSNIPAFHKLALEDISLGEQVIKYGEVIGIATSEIQCGEYVHVHNVESNRGRGDKAGGQ
jgi:altronate dehydratase small subunit